MNILICDDHALFRAGLRLVLGELEESTELLEASSAEETLRIADTEPDWISSSWTSGCPAWTGSPRSACCASAFLPCRW